MSALICRNQLVSLLGIAWLFALSAGCSNDPSPQLNPTETPQQAAASQPARNDEAPTRRDQMLVDRDELEAMLSREGVVVVDTRQEDEYLTAHVPGAVRVDVTAWQQKGLEEGGLDDAEFWANTTGELGIDNDTKVVVYGNSPTTAARIWWHLAYAGVPQVMLLDGGWNLWNVGGKPTETDATTPEPAEFEPKFDKSLLVTKEQLKQKLGDPDDETVVLDTRTEGEYLGKDVRGSRGGHLPDAVHCEWSEMLDANGRFKSNEEIRQVVALRDIQPDAALVTHCQSGGRASLELFALRMAGFENAANFYGGWSQWSEDKEAPVEK
jgi:thiosulfate/3-mercaptopyruvate sulfurtransferase